MLKAPAQAGAFSIFLCPVLNDHLSLTTTSVNRPMVAIDKFGCILLHVTHVPATKQCGTILLTLVCTLLSFLLLACMVACSYKLFSVD